MSYDFKWLETLNKNPHLAWTGVVVFVALLGLDRGGIIRLGDVPAGNLFAVVGLVVCLGFAASHAFKIIFAHANSKRHQSLLTQRRASRKAEERREYEEQRGEQVRKVLQRLEALSAGELSLIAEALREGRQSFIEDYADPSVQLLRKKGFVNLAANMFEEHRAPFVFPDDIWAGIVERKDELLRRHDAIRRAAQEAAGRRRY